MNQLQSLDLTNESKVIPYQLGKWDCFYLAKKLADIYFGVGKFPDIGDKFKGMNESESSSQILQSLPEHCDRVSDGIKDGDLLVLRLGTTNVLASYYVGNVYYMTRDGEDKIELAKISRCILSTWRLR